MLTREIVRLDELGLVKIRIIEDDEVTCLSEPCYPLSMFSGDDEINEFADIILRRTVKNREAVEIAMAEADGQDLSTQE